MSEFDDFIEEHIGDETSLDDIRVTVRRAWFYDFLGYPLYVWQGCGELFTIDNKTWLGTVDSNGTDYHKTPTISDGRDGSTGSYNMTLTIPDLPSQTPMETYNLIKDEQNRVSGRKLICYLVAFKEGEGLRPQTPITFFKEFIMVSPKFSEKIEQNSAGVLIKKYSVTVVCKDNNFGRSNVPNGTYTDAIQKERARQLGVENDRGCEYVGILANRTYVIP